MLLPTPPNAVKAAVAVVAPVPPLEIGRVVMISGIAVAIIN
jgi:hypothetical protein